MMTLGQNIRRFREAADLTQQDLAVAVDSNASYISVIENDVKVPGAELLSKISRALHCTPNDLLGFSISEVA